MYVLKNIMIYYLNMETIHTNFNLIIVFITKVMMNNDVFISVTELNENIA